MSYLKIKEKYFSLLDAQILIIKESNTRVLNEDPDQLFLGNINFFVKAYLISICTYLEAYLQEIVELYHAELVFRVSNAKIPFNFIYFHLGIELKGKDAKFEAVSHRSSGRNIIDDLSGNPEKTKKVFARLGLDASKNKVFYELSAEIHAIVDKRNKIIHHNNDASDISFDDLICYIESMKKYMGAFPVIVSAA